MTWTPAKILQIQTLASTHTTAQIAEIVGKTKNAVIGKLHRLKIPMQGFASQPHPHSRVNRKKASVEAANNRKVKIKAVVAKSRERVAEAQGVPSGKPIPWPPAFGLCGYIIGEVRQMRCCGASVKSGSQYCDGHHTACFEKVRFPVTR